MRCQHGKSPVNSNRNERVFVIGLCENDVCVCVRACVRECGRACVRACVRPRVRACVCEREFQDLFYSTQV